MPVTRTRSRRLPMALSSLALVVVLAGCSGQRDPGGYGDFEGTFKDSCVAQTLLDANNIKVGAEDTLDEKSAKAEKGSSKSQISESKKYCNCVWREIKKDVKYSKFKEYNDDLRTEGGTVPKEITKAYASCAEPKLGA